MRKFLAGLGVGLVLTTTGVAVAAIPDRHGVIHACYKKTTGVLRVINTEPGLVNGIPNRRVVQRCSSDERPLEWRAR